MRGSVPKAACCKPGASSQPRRGGRERRHYYNTPLFIGAALCQGLTGSSKGWAGAGGVRNSSQKPGDMRANLPALGGLLIPARKRSHVARQAAWLLKGENASETINRGKRASTQNPRVVGSSLPSHSHQLLSLCPSFVSPRFDVCVPPCQGAEEQCWEGDALHPHKSFTPP